MLLNRQPLGSKIFGLNAFGALIFEAGAVKAVSLAAALLQKATYGGVT